MVQVLLQAVVVIVNQMNQLLVFLLTFHVISVTKLSVLEKNLSNTQHRNTVDNNNEFYQYTYCFCISEIEKLNETLQNRLAETKTPKEYAKSVISLTR